ncbi:hypothetical protein [Methanosarcina barkeri]|uniref:hypothetical protein n=1 Tax=Methanosarcina barkeri TaxID=2208 RepID=UPI000A8E2D0E|nr:hypothetical protein [Methanosarcina barkeri]
MQVAEEMSMNIIEELNGNIGNIALKLRGFIRDQVASFKKKRSCYRGFGRN